jgi:hypothetical protein
VIRKRTRRERAVECRSENAGQLLREDDERIVFAQCHHIPKKLPRANALTFSRNSSISKRNI